MEIIVTDEFASRYRLLPKLVQRKAEKKERIFRESLFHPSLHTEKLQPKGRQMWSFRVDRQYRILFRFIDRNTVLFLTVGSHDWIYKVYKLLQNR